MTTTPAGTQIPDSLRPFIPAIVNEGLPTNITMKAGDSSVAISGSVDLSHYVKQQKCDDRFQKLANKFAKIRMNIIASSNGHPIDVKCETYGPFSEAQKKMITELRSHIANRANVVLSEISAKISKPVPASAAPMAISTHIIRDKNLAAIRDLRAMNDKLTVAAAAVGDRKAVAMGNQVGSWYDELDSRIKTRKTFSRIQKMTLGRGAREIFIGVEGVDKAPARPKTTRKPMMVAKKTSQTTTKLYTTEDRLFSETSSPKYKVPMKYALPKASFDHIVAVVADLGKNNKLFNAKHVIARLKKVMKDPPADSWTTKVLGMLRQHKTLGRSARSYVLADAAGAAAICRKVWASLQLR